MTIPNTPAELLNLNEQPRTPYNRPQVEAAMELLQPSNGANLGDLQAMAEICISIMKDVAQADSEDDSDAEWQQIASETLCNLKIAETFLEKSPYIAMNDDD